ncbi:2OG-Fe dioxygenase family protein [Streptomyces roseochromogenus]|uniref:2OG-Fe dioxygenase family protein n=1 Tax=Streptomyces roseochromogenus subsp. oscitans DS 12.976 TaxID=1352936 RepID=V6K8J0_STRRC|nr:2OG-Fe dioxygenase family protein [Streptomyces roseochromogenus]EST28452.1 hypothetical protein M878_22525 [Streptomyces roseochromogenus subsp. oscitans DS 12.976]
MNSHITQDRPIAQELRDLGYAAGQIDTVLGRSLTASPEWQTFLSSWDRLVLDPFMADGGDYRVRRYSEFDCTAESVELLPHRAYHQTKRINQLNGGVERLFEPFEDEVARGPVVHSLLAWCARQLDEAEKSPGTWYAQCFQNRILARPQSQGKPTPEGIHRDGVDYVFTVVVGRNAADGGASSLYAAEPGGGHGRELVSVVLQPPGDFLLNDDERTLHGVTPIVSTVEGGTGHRDTFIAVLTRRT